MIMPVFISVVVLLLVFGSGAAIWFVSKQKKAIKSKEPAKQTTAGATLVFHWSYVILPVVILFLSIVLTAYFYNRLPAELAYHFEPDGSPDKWLSRGTIILALLLTQLFFTLLAGAITWGITRLSVQFQQPENTGVKMGGMVSLMGNMFVIPQAIFGFAMLDIFSYNSYQVHLLPLWVFTLIVMVLGGIILGIFFIRAMWQAWGTTR